MSEIAAIRTALGVERLHILGHSWGGIVANRYGEAVGMLMRRHIARTSLRDVALPYMAPTPEDRGLAVGDALVGNDLFGAGLEGVLAGFDDEALLPRISVPTLLLGGEFDIVTADATKALLPMLKDGTYAEIGGAGHMAQFDQPDAWRNVLAAFVTRCD